MLNPNAIPDGSITQQKIDPSVLAGKQSTLTDTDGSYGQRVAKLEKEGIASQEKLTELEQKADGIIGGDIEQEITFNGSGYIKTDVSVGTSVDVNSILGQTSSWKYRLIEVVGGQTFNISGSGTYAPRLWCFLDESYILRNNNDRAVANESADGKIIVAPEYAKYLIINDNSDGKCYTTIHLEGQAAKKEDLNALQNELSNVSTKVDDIGSKMSYIEEGDSIVADTLVLDSAYIDKTGKVDSWTSSSYNIYSYQAQEAEDIKIVKTASVYVTNDVICKCRTLNGISVGGHIDGEVICTGTDYPFEAIVHLEQGEYIVRSGVKGTYSQLNILNHKTIISYARSLNGVKVDFEGDSVMEANSANGGWATLIQQMEGVVATNNGVSGSRITNAEGRTSILQRILSRTPSDFDMIIVQGGFNDGSSPLGTFSRNDYRDEGVGDYDPTTYYGALEIICRYCLKNFPKAGMIVGYNWGLDTWNTTLADAMVAVCEKWGMPYVDLRTKAGFNLHTEALREKYGIYNGDVPVYDESKGYALDEKTKYDGRVYKANQVIASPAGTFDSSKWTYIGMEYDQCHCNLDGYKKSVGAIIQMMKALVE